ncbi:MAG: methyltransferase domain-containing protein [Actinomycetota bacterium]|nr:MAG: methyltransferase domain-containing protein [Actinomycetota bacterium]
MSSPITESAGSSGAGGDGTTTTADDYGAHYYRHHLGPPYEPGHPHWTAFFDAVAERIVTTFRPATVLDAGCAKGILVGSLVGLGVDASGVDVSDYAIADGDPRAAGRLRVGSLVEPIEGRFDLITCIEVIEHMAQADAELALDNICAATDVLLLSTTPFDLNDTTHVNVRMPAHWASMLADRGFYRRFDLDLSWLTPWAAAYQRQPLSVREIVHGYEDRMPWLQIEVNEKRAHALGLSHELGEQEQQAEQLRHELLRQRDLVLGLQAEAARAQWEAEDATDRLEQAEQLLTRSRARARELENRLRTLSSSRALRVGQAVLRPAVTLRRKLR